MYVTAFTVAFFNSRIDYNYNDKLQVEVSYSVCFVIPQGRV